MTRRALLLGIPVHDDKQLCIDAAKNDVGDVATALKRSGFPNDGVLTLADDLTTGRIRKAIRKFLAQASEDDALVIYFSGHGVVFNGKRLLVPMDFDRDNPVSVHELVSDIDIYAQARTSRAASVVVLLDACREGVQLEIRPASTKGVAGAAAVAATASTDTPTIAVVHSCEEHQFSYFDPGVAGRSDFTAALCEVLQRPDGPATLGVILREVGEILHQKGRGQSPRFGESCSGRAGPPEELLLKEDVAARLDQQIRDSSWCCGLRETRLFQSLSDCSALQRQVEAIVLRCHQHFIEADRLPDQRWRGADCSQRLVERLELLLGMDDAAADGRGASLSPPEVALALAAPHVYEAVLAIAELHLAKTGDRLAPDVTADPTDAEHIWRTWRTAYLGDERWRRRRELVQRDKGHCIRDVAAWQLVRFLHRSGELWQTTHGINERYAWLGAALAEITCLAPFQEVRADPRVGQVLSSDRLVGFARLLFCTREDIELEYDDGGGESPHPATYFGEGAKQWSVDERKLAHLLSLAGRLALDARRLPEAPAEHIGIDPGVDAKSLVVALKTAEWHRVDGGGLSLSLSCFHQALDLALELDVRILDDHLRRLRDAVHGRDTWAAVLPRGADSRGVRPGQQNNRDVYQRPHLRFQLDPDRVRELLMGKNLYGDPRYALREAYQNALDACRYRRAREEYVQRRNPGEARNPYVPSITFRTGTAKDRPFIECCDNGVGMDRRHLEELFARVGRRFADSHEFHLEKARWDEVGVPFWSNSRFGIGVLAYFMLADEVVVWTRRVGEHGVPAQRGLVARILSGSDLFRVAEDPGACPNGGTRVRLYLDGRPETQRGVPLLETISSWLALPEVRVELLADSRVIREFSPGELSLYSLPALETQDDKAGLLFPVGEPDELGQHRIWCLIRSLTTLQSELLALPDGILGSEDNLRGKGVTIFANLKGDQAPVLSVDRSQILDWSDGKSWLGAELQRHLFMSATAVNGMTYGHLAILAACFPWEASQFDRALLEADVQDREFPFAAKVPTKLKLLPIGVCQADGLLIFGELAFPKVDVFMPREHSRRPVVDGPAAALLRARLAALRQHGLRMPGFLGAVADFDASRPEAPSVASGWPPLSLLSSRLKSVPPFSDDLPWPRLLQAAAQWESSLGEVLEIARPLAGLGVKLPPLDNEAARLRPTPRTAQLLSRDFDAQPPFLDLLTVRHLLDAAARWECSLGEVLEMARPLAELGVKLPPLDDEAAGLRPTARMAQLLDADARPPFLDSLTPAQLFKAAVGWKCSLGHVFEIARPLAVLGVKLPTLGDEAAGLRPTGRTAQLLSRDLDAKPPFLSLLTPPHLVGAAAHWKCSLGEVLKIAGALGELLPDLPTLGDDAAGLRPTARMAQLLSRGLDARPPFLHSLTPPQLVRAAARWECSLGEVLEMARPLAGLGVKLPTLDDEAAGLRPTGRMARLLSRDLDAQPPFLDSLSSPHLVRAVAHWQCSLGEVLDLARRLEVVGIGLPDLSPDFTPTSLPSSVVCRILQTMLQDDRTKSLSLLSIAIVADEVGAEFADLETLVDPLQFAGFDVEELRDFLAYSSRSRR